VHDPLIYLEQVKKFYNTSNVMKFRSFGDSTSSSPGQVKDDSFELQAD